MRKRVYIETTVVSYLVARPSRDLIVAAHQEITREWWERFRGLYDLLISQLVIDEASGGDPEAAAMRLRVLQGLPTIQASVRSVSLAEELIAKELLAEKAAIDALHLSLAIVHGIDILLTWNCRHLANAATLGDIGRHVRSLGYEMPIVCTPEELTGEDGGQNEE